MSFEFSKYTKWILLYCSYVAKFKKTVSHKNYTMLLQSFFFPQLLILIYLMFHTLNFSQKNFCYFITSI